MTARSEQPDAASNVGGSTNGLLAGAASLDDVMATQRDLYRGLLAIAHQEREAIILGDVEMLTALVDQKEALLDHLRALETDRMTALVAIEAATGIPAEDATISGIAARLPSDHARSLTGSARALRADLVAVDEAQRVNERLLENSRSLLDRWLHHLRAVLAGSIYDAGGSAVERAGGRTLNKSA